MRFSIQATNNTDPNLILFYNTGSSSKRWIPNQADTVPLTRTQAEAIKQVWACGTEGYEIEVIVRETQ